MNILPKKRWHVRTRENIARVRKDEQEAFKEADEKRQRVLKAEKEARTALLRQRATAKYGVPEENLKGEGERANSDKFEDRKHVNFFEELEEEKIVVTKTNKETELEEKEKREKYEKQIGYLTYLGQDTVESTGNVPWYDKVPNRNLLNCDFKEEKSSKSKLLHDPLTVIRKYVPAENKSLEKDCEARLCSGKSSKLEYQPILKRKEKKKMHKKRAKKRKRKISSSSSSDTDSESGGEVEKRKKMLCRKSLEQLRTERLKREKDEREKSEQLLARLQGKSVKEAKEEPTPPSQTQQKYNSQYNPDIAKQNFASYSKNQ